MGRYKQHSSTTQHLIRPSRPMPISLLEVTYKSIWNTEGSCVFAQILPHNPVKINLKTEVSPKKEVSRVKPGLGLCCGIKHGYTFKLLLLAFRTTWAGMEFHECSYGPVCKWISPHIFWLSVMNYVNYTVLGLHPKGEWGMFKVSIFYISFLLSPNE